MLSFGQFPCSWFRILIHNNIIEPWTVTYLYAEWAAQHGGARRTGDNAARSVEVLGPEDDHCCVPDTVQRAA
jgi:hypothetical protein